MDVVVVEGEGDGEGELFMNLEDLYFDFFASTPDFFDSSLSFLNVCFEAAPLPLPL